MKWWALIIGILCIALWAALGCFTGNKGVEQSPRPENKTGQSSKSDQSATAGGDVNQENTVKNENKNDQSTTYNLPAWATVLLVLGSQLTDKLFRRFKPYRKLDEAVKGRNGTSAGDP